MKLQSYAYGEWSTPKKAGKDLFNAVTGEKIGECSSDGLNFKEMLEFARTKGNTALRKQTFHERARALKALALYLLERKDKYYQLSYATGATKRDSWIDIEGGIGNLFVYSSKGRRELPDKSFMIDGKVERISKEGTFLGRHIFTPKTGCALHINAFNFPIWGMLEKIAVNLLAGVPAIVKPASSTSFLTEIVFKDIIKSNLLPVGALQLICGSVGDIFDHLDSQDIVTFTGSASTGQMLKGHENIIKNSIPFNMEADSLNCCILSPESTPETEEFKIFIKEVSNEMTVKAGQKCTAIRRIIVPENLVEDVSKALSSRLSTTTVGNPTSKEVRMGSLASFDQQDEVQNKIKELKTESEMLFSGEGMKLVDADIKKGAFALPHLLYCEKPLQKSLVHEVEAFGPVSTIIPYKNTDEAIELARKGGGSLVGSLVGTDTKFIRDVILESACQHGRMVILNAECAKESTGHGSPLPQLVHGGPGRAGGGEEMGGLRGLSHYMQRTALQGHPSVLTAITGEFHPGSNKIHKDIHPFQRHFEELEIGETYITQGRTITESDIVQFANVSWDHFYAHTDVTSLEGTIFEQRVAHGYFIISAAAGLFVDGKKGPVLANYGLDELRFTEPVYAGTTIHVHLSVKEKVDQEVKEDERPRGIVKWYVDVRNQDNETVALATILTLVAKLDKKA